MHRSWSDENARLCSSLALHTKCPPDPFDTLWAPFSNPFVGSPSTPGQVTCLLRIPLHTPSDRSSPSVTPPSTLYSRPHVLTVQIRTFQILPCSPWKEVVITNSLHASAASSRANRRPFIAVERALSSSSRFGEFRQVCRIREPGSTEEVILCEYSRRDATHEERYKYESNKSLCIDKKLLFDIVKHYRSLYF